VSEGRSTLVKPLVGLARRAYRAVERGPLRGVLAFGQVQRARSRLRTPMEAADVLEVLDRLAAAGIRAWLAGGWGADALVGEQTRPHGDVDLVVAEQDEQAAERALAQDGFRPVPNTARHVPGAILADRLVLQDPRGRVIDMHTVDLASWPGVPDVGEPFTTGRVAGRDAPCVSLGVQLAARRGYEPKPTDRHDLERLSRL